MKIAVAIFFILLFCAWFFAQARMGVELVKAFLYMAWVLAMALAIYRPVLISALIILIIFINFIGIILDKKEEKRIEEESRREQQEYTEMREDLAGRFREILLNGGFIKPYSKKPGILIGYLPDGRIKAIDLGGLTDIWAGERAPERISPGADPESILASPDLMILRMGHYRVTAAGRIIKRTKEACGALGDAPCLHISENRRTVAGVDSAGRIASVTFDMPVDRLFEGLDGTDSYWADRLGPLEKNVVSAETLLAPEGQEDCPGHNSKKTERRSRTALFPPPVKGGSILRQFNERLSGNQEDPAAGQGSAQ